MFINRKTQHCHDVCSSQIDLQIQCNPNQNPNKLFCAYQQTDSEVYVKEQKTQKSQHNIEDKEQSWRTDTTQLEDLLQCYSNQDNVNRTQQSAQK